jgi:restriction endonuclease S subunit
MLLGMLADVQMGYPFRSRLQHDPQGDVAVIQMKDIDDANLLHADDAIRVTLPKGKTHHLLRAGDLVFRSRGRSNGAALVATGVRAAVLSAPMLLIRRPRGVLPDYLCWFINAPSTQAQLAALAEGTSVRMISAEALKALDVPLPAIAAQRRIVQAAALAQEEQSLVAEIAMRRKRLTTHVLMQYARQKLKKATS